jgi:RNA polymerase sigma-70 factor (ECF subfamily)
MDRDQDERRLDGEAQARFLRLFLSSERELFRYVSGLVPNVSDAEEIVQQTAVALWSKFDQYDAALPFTPWACRFAMNVIKQWAERRQKWQSLLEGGLAEELAKRREELRPRFEGRMRHLEGCLEKLPADHRRIVEAYYLRRKSVDVVAGEMRRSVDAIYKVLQRARSMLRNCIEQASGGPAT